MLDRSDGNRVLMLPPFVELEISAGGTKRYLTLLADQPITVGSDPQCNVVINDSSFAPRAATLLWNSDGVLILQPFETTNPAGLAGSFILNGNPIIPPVAVREGEALTVGSTAVVWRKLSDTDCPTIVSSSARLPAAELLAELKGGRYRSGDEIGRGGMGKVLSVTEKTLRRTVAFKVLLDSESKENQRRFIREAQITGGLEHPSIVPVHELNVDETGRVFYTMKLVKGLTLHQILRDLAAREPAALSPYKLPSLLTIFQKVCDAVAFAHSQPTPIIHRDLKPANIMIGDYGEVLVMDWGAAKFLSSDAEDSNESKDREQKEPLSLDQLLLTRPGSVIGTPGYMAPEQAAGHADIADERTDIFALGGILYSLLTLEAPMRVTAKDIETFEVKQDDKTSRLFHKQIAPLLSDRSSRPRLDHLPGKMAPDSLVAVALKAMSFRPEDRFESVKQLQTDIAAYQAGRATRAEAANAWKHFKLLVRRNKVLFTSIASVFAILLAATAISVYERRATLKSNQVLQLTLQQASRADLETARQRIQSGKWREGIALLGRALTFWAENRDASNYLLSAIAFGRGDRDKLPIFGVYHNAFVSDVAFSPDGRFFATASQDYTTKVWDAATGTQVGKTLFHNEGCGMPCFSPDSRQLVTTAGDGVVKLWDVQTGKLLVTMRHGRPDLDSLSSVMTAIFSSDGKRILTSSFDHTARVWDASSGREIAQLVNPHRVADARFSPDETRILTSYWYGGAMLWDAKTFQRIGAPMTHEATVKKSVFTPDGTKVVTSSLDQKARIWDGHTGDPLTSPLKHGDFVWELDVNPDGKLVATASYDKTIRLWSTADGTALGVAMRHEGPVNTVAFSPDGKRLVSASRDRTVRLWDVATCREIGNPMRHDETVLRAIFNPADETKVLSVGWDNAGYLWDARAPPWPGEVIPIPAQVCSIEFENDDRLFVATRDGQAGSWSLSRKEFITPVVHLNDPISLARYHSASRQIATASHDGAIHFWSAGKQTGATQPSTDTIVALAFAADGQSLFAAYLSGSVIQWKIPEGTQIGNVMKHSEKMDALAVAPSGKELATGCRDDSLYLWKLGGNTPPRKLRHNNPVRAVTYSPDGHFIATGCDDNTARIWSVDSDKQLGEPFYLNGRPTTLHYTADGNALLVGGTTDTDVDYFDVKTHNSLCIPLPHPIGVSQITSNASGSLVVTVTNDGVARLWRIPTTSEPPPKWLPDYLRAIGGLTFSAQQQLSQVSTRERLDLRKKLLSQPRENTIWDKLMRWSFDQKPSPAPSVTSQ